jgi:type II secretory pathway pseudopilin PulG
MKGAMSRVGADTAKGTWQCRLQTGWSLLEVVVTTAIVGTLGVAVICSMLPQIATSKTNQCMANLQMIEAAKNAWVADHPGQAMSTPSAPGGSDDPLISYIRGGIIPACPSGGTYQNVYDPTKPCICPSPSPGPGHGLQAYPTPSS